MHLITAWKVLKRAITDFMGDDVFTLAGALAFYTTFSLAPLLLLLVWIGSMLGPGTQEALVNQLVGIIGSEGGEAVQAVITDDTAQAPTAQTFAGIISIGVLLFSATTVFAQLQYSLNVIWGVETKPGRSVTTFLRTRLLSLGMVLALGFLLLVSMIASAVLSALVASARSYLPGGDALWAALDPILSIVIFSLLFAVMFRLLPDVNIDWQDTWFGAITTAVLFVIGKILLGLYLGRAGVGSGYGAAGSFIALLVWVYYASIIVFFGAELTQAWAHVRGRRIEPDSYAQWRGNDGLGEGQERRDPKARRPQTA